MIKFFQGPVVRFMNKPAVSGIIDGHDGGITARSLLPRKRLGRHSALAAPMTGGAGRRRGG